MRKSPQGSPSRGGDVAVYVFDINQQNLPRSFFFILFLYVYFCLYGPFNCISFHKFPRQLSAFSLCSSDLISGVLVLSTLFMKVSFSPDIILWAGLKALTNSITSMHLSPSSACCGLVEQALEEQHGDSFPLTGKKVLAMVLVF